jgi:hypothetical protein
MMPEPLETTPAQEAWPPLPFAAWRETQATLHMWTQIVGKVALELTPFLNEWWNIAFQVTPRGLTTGPIPAAERTFRLEFDFIAHALVIRGSDGAVQAIPLHPRSVADFYAELMATLASLGLEVTINPLPVEIPHPLRFDRDHVHAAYDGEAVQRWWRILVQIDNVVQRFRTPFVGKSSPVNVFWGSFDLSHTRFSGRPATPPAAWPRFMRLAEEQENFACGFWPGNAGPSGLTLGEPAFYAYIFPEPAGFQTAAVRPLAAAYHAGLGELIIPYDAVRQSAAPAEAVLDFFQSAYEAAATHAGWDRDVLERRDEV